MHNFIIAKPSHLHDPRLSRRGLPTSAQPLTRSSEPPPRGSFLGLQSAVELALQNHPAVQEGNANLKASEARTEQTRSAYYPQVYANADTTAGAGRPTLDSLSAELCSSKIKVSSWLE